MFWVHEVSIRFLCDLPYFDGDIFKMNVQRVHVSYPQKDLYDYEEEYKTLHYRKTCSTS